MAREPRAGKASVVKDVRERFDEAEAVLVTEYRGLDVTQMTELRNALRDAEAIYKIYKNTLVRRALEEGFPESFVDMLVGPTALAFTDKNPGAAAKALKQFAAVNDALIIKGGLLNGEVLDEAQVRLFGYIDSPVSKHEAEGDVEVVGIDRRLVGFAILVRVLEDHDLVIGLIARVDVRVGC